MPSTDLDIGDELPALRLTLTREQVAEYARAANQAGPRFLSDAGARQDGLPGQIVPGNMSLALFSRLLGAIAGARVRRISGTFRGLVRPNVPLVVSGVVTDRQAGAGGDVLECDLLLETEEGDRLVVGTGTLVIAAGVR
jgi:acyl dehydratase